MNKMKARANEILIDTPILPVLIVFFIASAFFVPNFATAYNIKNYFLQASDLLVVSCGLTFVVLNGGIDFSVTATLTLGSVMGAYIMALSPVAGNPMVSIPLAIVTMIGIGLIVGLINGIAVANLKIPSFIATMATNLVFSGLAVLLCMNLTGKSSIYGISKQFFVLGGSGKYFIVPIAVSAVCCLLCHWLLRSTKFGRDVYAIGINNVCAEVSGVKVKKVTVSIMLLSGLFAAVEGILLTARNEAGVASLGDKMFLAIIACVIVGGTSTSGGFGGIKQTLYGVLFITLLNNTMNLLQVEWNLLMLFQGILILVATLVGINVKKSKRLNVIGGKQ
jgi:Ribose/xylose/arabinose/galactoside ABC-type transport systems, permease components